MAIYNEIQVGRFNRLLQKLLSMKGPASMNQLAPELVTSIVIFHGVEDRYLEGWDRFGQLVQLAAPGIGLASSFRIRNPSGSNVVAVVESLSISNQAGVADQGQITIGVTVIDLAVIQPQTNRTLDSRGRNSFTVITSTGTGGGAGGFITQKSFPANGTADFMLTDNQEIPIVPGMALTMTQLTTNQGFVVGAIWRERFLEDSERA